MNQALEAPGFLEYERPMRQLVLRAQELVAMGESGMRAHALVAIRARRKPSPPPPRRATAMTDRRAEQATDQRARCVGGQWGGQELLAVGVGS